MKGGREPRVAVVHDWLIRVDGSVRTLAEILRTFPRADLFTLVDALEPEERAFLGGRVPRTSFLRRMPKVRSLAWYYVPLMPAAVEQLDLSGYDLVISSSSGFAKGVVVGPDQVHVAYTHSPLRFVWDLQAHYLERFGWRRGPRRWAATAVFHYLRQWDRGSGHGVDHWVAGSRFVARRVEKVHRRPAAVVYPPVEVERFAPAAAREGFYLTAAYMNPFKNLELVVRAFTRTPHRRLVVVGDGPERPRLERIAGENVSFAGAVDDAELASLMGRARAFVYAAPEDFGIVMAEALAAGAPVVALGVGGACEIVRPLGDDPDPTGVLFDEATPESLLDALDRFEAERFSSATCRASALRFSPEAFRDGLRGEVDAALRARGWAGSHTEAER